jgi:5-methylcytosine-specific restriction protein B
MARGFPERYISIDRKAVLQAMAKFDELGRERFLREYGFREARNYVIRHDGKEYDAKAIVGVAQGLANPEQPPLTGKDFHSSDATVRQRLERLDFVVADRRTPTSAATAPETAATEEQAVAEPVKERSQAAYGPQNIVSDGAFMPEAEITQMVARLQAKKNLILQGPPGTGKTWLAKRLGFAILETSAPGDALRVVQFHPSLSYEDFVRGYRPGGDGKLGLTDGVFLEIVQAARRRPDEDFVLVIEEINRGNPAQIFGEMLTLLENTKRQPEEALQLAYRHHLDERVYIPDNLYVVGTMNVADRSLALVDLALRRRFAFVTLRPLLESGWAAWCREKGKLSEEVLRVIAERITEVNAIIAEDRSLGPQFQLGHSFVTPTAPVPDGWRWFREVVETEIDPLLNEYWFDQTAKAKEALASLLAPPVA